ncbi:hypothetical protein BC628DRAFT_138998 [Trametes gibbosa]|nr:hypothetical protein BC628DRAFT_138998 [Trametes gibbosa]
MKRGRARSLRTRCLWTAPCLVKRLLSSGMPYWRRDGRACRLLARARAGWTAAAAAAAPPPPPLIMRHAEPQQRRRQQRRRRRSRWECGEHRSREGDGGGRARDARRRRVRGAGSERAGWGCARPLRGAAADDDVREGGGGPPARVFSSDGAGAPSPGRASGCAWRCVMVLVEVGDRYGGGGGGGEEGQDAASSAPGDWPRRGRQPGRGVLLTIKGRVGPIGISFVLVFFMCTAGTAVASGSTSCLVLSHA